MVMNPKWFGDSFDQSFSRVGSTTQKIQGKLKLLKKTGNYGFYYDSHARFLFAAESSETLYEVEQQILPDLLISELHLSHLKKELKQIK